MSLNNVSSSTLSISSSLGNTYLSNKPGNNSSTILESTADSKALIT